jgi:hypothetical protein
MGVDGGPSEERVLSVLGEGVPGGTARIRFEVFKPGDVTLSIYSVGGRLIRRLVDGPLQPNTYLVDWDGLDDGGAKAASGVYFLRLDTEYETSTGKAIIAR